MESIPSDRQLIVIVIGAITIAILATVLGILFGPESTITLLMLDTVYTVLLIGLKGDKK